MSDLYDTIIIGGGPAGLSGALILGRCLRRTVVLDSGRYRNKSSEALHCFMSRDGIPPAKLLAQAREQLRAYESIDLTHAEARYIERAGAAFAVGTDDRILKARTVLVATGVVDELPDIQGMGELFGRSVHVCPYCDGWEHRNAPVAAFGKADKGVALAMLLRQWTDDLVLCTHGPGNISPDDCRRLESSGIGLREERIARLESVEGRLTSILFTDGTRLARHALFFNTGQHPRSTLLEKLGCAYGPKGIECDADGQTSVPGIYVAGDVSRDVQLAIIAAAEGARAALAINRALLAQDGRA
jgi:thioredoxin reductase